MPPGTARPSPAQRRASSRTILFEEHSRSPKISRLSAAAVLCLTPIAFTTAANSAEPAPDLGRARNEVPATEPAPAASSNAGLDTETWAVLGATGAAVVGLGLAGGLLVRRRHAHLPHPV